MWEWGGGHYVLLCCVFVCKCVNKNSWCHVLLPSAAFSLWTFLTLIFQQCTSCRTAFQTLQCFSFSVKKTCARFWTRTQKLRICVPKVGHTSSLQIKRWRWDLSDFTKTAHAINFKQWKGCGLFLSPLLSSLEPRQTRQRVFFSQEQETAFFILASVKTLANSCTNAIDFVCGKNTRSTKFWFSHWLREKYPKCEQAIKAYSHRRQIGIRPELSGRIAMQFNTIGQFGLKTKSGLVWTPL